MGYLELKTKLKDFLIFTVNDIKKIDFRFHSQRLSEWQDKGYIKKITKEFYVFSDLPINEQIMFLIANKIYPHSYISLEAAFSYYNLIPEGVYAVTSVTSGKTNSFKTQIGQFNYRHVKPELIFGYDLTDYNGKNFKMVRSEKAILDYLYLNPHIKSADDFKGLRFNAQEFKEITDAEKIKRYAEAFQNKNLTKRLVDFMRFIDHA